MTPNSPSSGNESVPSPGTERSGQDPGSLFMDHWDRLRRMVEIRLDRRLHGRVDPSDVLQETYIEFARSLPGFLRNPAIPMFLWLRHITGVRLKAVHRRHLGTRVRDAGRDVGLGRLIMPHASSVSLAAQLLGRLTSPSQAAARAELQSRVRDALDDLAAIDREVLCLRHFEQLSNAEAAQVLGIGETAASNRYVRALKRIGKTLQGVSGGPDPPADGPRPGAP
jgi:RNA polymerase sigma-70 factor (ECF subfamily)